MLRENDILVETAFRTYRVRVDRFGGHRPTAAQFREGRRLASDLRSSLADLEPRAVTAAQRLVHAFSEIGPFQPRRADGSNESHRFFEELGDVIAMELAMGRRLLVVPNVRPKQPEQVVVRQSRREPPPDLSPRRAPPLETSFEVRFVDEIGQAISGLDVKVQAGDRVEQLTTNAAGVALLDGTTAGSGAVSILDPAALEDILEPRWSKLRSGRAPRESNTTEKPFDGRPVEAVTIKGGVPNTVIIKPKVGTLFVELWDKTGRVLHAKRDYTISGPVQLSGTTDDQGRLFHEGVPLGTYTLTLVLNFFDGDDRVTEKYETAVLVQGV